MQQQNRNLLAQKQEYVDRLQLLTDEMAKLKGKKKELLEGRKTPETEQFLKENNKFQVIFAILLFSFLRLFNIIKFCSILDRNPK